MNLLEDRWLPVASTTGDYSTISMKTLFSSPHHYANIHHPSPLVVVSTIKFLIATVVSTLKPSPNDTASWITSAFPSEDMVAALERINLDISNLSTPLYQVKGLKRSPSP